MKTFDPSVILHQNKNIYIFFLKNMVLTRGKPYLGLDSSGNAHPPGRHPWKLGGVEGNWRDIWRDQHFCQCSFPCAAHIFWWYATYPSTRVGFLENVHARSPAEGGIRLNSRSDTWVSNPGSDGLAKGAYQRTPAFTISTTHLRKIKYITTWKKMD